MPTAAPRSFSPGSLNTAGLPADRQAHIAARQAFVNLKQTYMHALQDVVHADWLLAQVRAAEEPVDLWLLRAPVFAVLTGADPERRTRRQLLRRGLDSVFPDLDDPASGYADFAS
jgi:hypothetical protein